MDNKNNIKYKSMEKWIQKNNYSDPQYVTGVGWYAIPHNGYCPIPICPPNYTHEALKKY